MKISKRLDDLEALYFRKRESTWEQISFLIALHRLAREKKDIIVPPGDEFAIRPDWDCVIPKERRKG